MFAGWAFVAVVLSGIRLGCGVVMVIGAQNDLQSISWVIAIAMAAGVLDVIAANLHLRETSVNNPNLNVADKSGELINRLMLLADAIFITATCFCLLADTPTWRWLGLVVACHYAAAFANLMVRRRPLAVRTFLIATIIAAIVYACVGGALITVLAIRMPYWLMFAVILSAYLWAAVFRQVAYAYLSRHSPITEV